MQKWNPGFERGCIGNQRLILGSLDGIGSQEGKTGLTGSHDIRMVTVDGEGMRGYGTRGNMENSGSKLTGNFIHIGDH